MTTALNELATFLNPIGMTIVLVYSYGIFSRSFPSTLRVEVAMGVVFGIATWLAMATPIRLGDGVIVDLRCLFIGISAAFFGWRAAVVTTSMAIMLRIGLGGVGMIPGVVGVLITAVLGLFWRYKIEPRITNSFIAIGLLSCCVSMNMLSAFLLPQEVYLVFFQNLAPLSFVLNVFGSFIFALLITREMTLIGKENSLVTAATTDPLTKALNRRSVIEQYERIYDSIACRRGVAMVCIDVDHFKNINDTFGHLPGDDVLVEIAKRITSCLRPTDLFARMSGDEFLIVLTNISSEEARIVADRCRKIVSRAPVSSNDMKVPVSISVGTVWSNRYEIFSEFRDAADAALYQAKLSGRDRLAFNAQHDFKMKPQINVA